MQPGNLRSQINIENIYKQIDEINQINMTNENVPDEKNQIGESDEYRSTDDMEVLKLGTLCSKRNIYGIEKEYDETNQINIIDDKESDERYQINENEEEILNTDIEFLLLGNLVRRKIFIILKNNMMKKIR